MTHEQKRQFKMLHGNDCNEHAPNKELCDCAYSSVVCLSHSVGYLTDKMIEVLHRLENSKTPSDLPILAEPVRQRLRAEILNDLDRVSRQVLENWRAQTS